MHQTPKEQFSLIDQIEKRQMLQKYCSGLTLFLSNSRRRLVTIASVSVYCTDMWRYFMYSK